MKFLSWSITQLSKLRFLLLPPLFALETLPSHLNDSIIISVQGRHVRKTWKQLKLEIDISHFPIPQEPARCLSTITPPVYLKLWREDLERWICDNNSSVLLVNMLELHKSGIDDDEGEDDVQGAEDGIVQFSNLTHLYLTSYSILNNRLLDTITGLRHLTLSNFSFDFQSGNISKLSNLETLDVVDVNLPNNIDLPVSLRYVSFIGRDVTIESLPDSIAKLSNLISLELSGWMDLKSFPKTLNIHTLKIDDIIYPLPVGLRHLEILHPVDYCKDSGHFSCDDLEQCLTQLVNLETLSLTCSLIKSLPSIARLHNLRVLELKDCFSLSQLPSDVDELIELRTLDISGTRIKFIPDNFMELPKLQFIILSKCFRKESWPRNSERFIIDDTDEIYYEHLNYYDSCYRSSPDTSENEQNNPQNDIEKGKPQKIYIAAETIQELLTKKLRLVDAADQLHVSRSTFKRRLKELNIRWPSSKEGKQSLAKKRRLDSETHSRVDSLQQMVNSIDTTNENVKEYTIEANQLTLSKSGHDNVVENYLDPSLANVKQIVMAPQCDKAGYPLIEQQLDHPSEHTLSNIVHQDGNSETFTVKATYADDTVKFEFCLTNSMEQLEQEVGRRLKLEVGTFRIKYEDEDKDLIRMSCTSELEGLLRLSRSAGCNFVKLSICDERSQNRAQKSEESREHLTMKTEGEKLILYSTRNPLPFQDEMVSCILPFIEGYTEVKADGHCGFRAIAIFKYRDEEKWLDVRRDLMEELTTHKELYKRALGAEDEFKRACDIVNYYDTPAPEQHWYEATCLGLVVATKYQKICTHWSKSCPTTFLPLESRLVDKFPTEYINMALVRGNHFIALHMTTSNIPLPRLMPLWISHCNEDVKPWFLSHFKKQLDDFANKLH